MAKKRKTKTIPKRRKKMVDKKDTAKTPVAADPNKPKKAPAGTPLQQPPSQQSALGPVPKPGEPVGGPAQLPPHTASPETHVQTETFPDTTVKKG